MTHPNKRRGDRAELEVQAILRDHLGVPARRKLGAGRQDDMGDIDGVPSTVIAVRNRQDITRTVRELPIEAEKQRQRAADAGHSAWFAASFVRLNGGEYRVVLTVEQFCELWREAQ